MDNEKIQSYANEMPNELRKVINALSSDVCLSIFFVLYKYGEMTLSNLMNELEISDFDKNLFVIHLQILQKSSLIKKECVNRCSYYNITDLGETVIDNLTKSISIT